MGQEEVLEILEEKKEVTLKELSQKLDIAKNNIWTILMRVVKQGVIERRIIEPKEAEKYGLKRAGRNHIVWRLKGGNKEK